MIRVEKILEKDWGNTYGSCQAPRCNSKNITRIIIGCMEIRLCDVHLTELQTKLKRLS